MAYIELEDLKEYRGIDEDNSTKDEIMQKCIDRAQGYVDTYCNQSFEDPLVASTRLFRVLYEGYMWNSDGPIRGRELFLDRPLYTIDSITNGNGEIITSDAYVTDPKNDPPYHTIRLKASSGIRWEYGTDYEDSYVSVTGKWVYSLTPPDNIIQATTRLSDWLFHQRDNANDMDRAISVGNVMIFPARLPQDIKDFLDPYVRRELSGGY